MKTRDLLAGYFVTIEPHDDVWLVSLNTDDLSRVAMNTYQELPDALESVHEWMLMLTDGTSASRICASVSFPASKSEHSAWRASSAS
jgi:hypothetical protein